MRRSFPALRCYAFAFAVASALSLAPRIASAQATWSSWFSEENYYGQSCSAGRAVDGVRCDGSYCDNVSIRCNDLPDFIYDQYVVGGGFISEEYYINQERSEPNGWYGWKDSVSHVCNWDGEYPGVITGMRCAGRYCDSIAVDCAAMVVAGEPAEMLNCSWSGWYSEEDPWFAYGTTANRWISGVMCHGRYCDDKSYYVCSISAPADSCGGRCGTHSPSGCWCDDACVSLGDCCDDHAELCL